VTPLLHAGFMNKPVGIDRFNSACRSISLLLFLAYQIEAYWLNFRGKIRKSKISRNIQKINRKKKKAGKLASPLFLITLGL